ncbi:MAG TPA: SDR family NAD(P)-dependent oxidoreductase [Anaerolineales bacterium]|nr:SDR family NAD(P)-dependent oxidoreductase [Anaerolineales bacterium]
MKALTGTVVLITGAGKGSGRMLAKALAERGAFVAANDISPVNVEALVDDIVSSGGRAKAYIEDISKKMSAQHLIKQVEDDFGRIDVLIHHAAVEPRIPLLEMDEWDWHRVLAVNLTGAFLMTQSVGRVMRSQGSGVILFLITESGSGLVNEAAFVASMKGLEGFARQAAQELNPHGIRVHAIKNAGDGVVEKVLNVLSEMEA